MEDKHTLRKQLTVGLLVVEPIRRTGLRSILEEMRDIHLVDSDLAGLIAAESLDLILLSLMVREEMIAVVERLRAERPSTRIVVMSPDDSHDCAIAAIFAGARGYLYETAAPEEVWQAIEVVASGSIWASRQILSLLVDRMLANGPISTRASQPQFTQRELEVLQLLVSARSNREIALALGIEVRTVKSYVGRMMRKVGVGNRIALSIHAAKHALGSGGTEQ
jgi:DNA-binding NarL/FixJ family response regulator